MWHSCKPTIASGYGTQTKIMVRALRKLGHEVAISCSCGTTMATELWDGIMCFPDSGHIGKYGMDVVQTHAQRWGADVVWSWLDAFVIPPDVATKLGNWAAWVPVDSEPVMVRNVKPLESVRWRMAPTKWGVRMLEDAGLKRVMLLPCAHDPAQFHATSHVAAKAEFGKVINKDLTGKYLVNVVSANSAERKNFQAIFAAWKLFSANHPEALLYLHTDVTGYFSAGQDLTALAKLYGVENDSVCFVSQWEYNTGQLGEDYLALMYNASDLHLNCCFGEGFGLPIMDAQACGCPTVVPDFAAAGEIGLCYKVRRGNRYSTVPGAFQLMVDPEAVASAMELAYYARRNMMEEVNEGIEQHERNMLSKATAPWQVDNVVANHLMPILKQIADDRRDSACSPAC